MHSEGPLPSFKTQESFGREQERDTRTASASFASIFTSGEGDDLRFLDFLRLMSHTHTSSCAVAGAIPRCFQNLD